VRLPLCPPVCLSPFFSLSLLSPVRACRKLAAGAGREEFAREADFCREFTYAELARRRGVFSKPRVVLSSSSPSSSSLLLSSRVQFSIRATQRPTARKYEKPPIRRAPLPPLPRQRSLRCLLDGRGGGGAGRQAGRRGGLAPGCDETRRRAKSQHAADGIPSPPARSIRPLRRLAGVVFSFSRKSRAKLIPRRHGPDSFFASFFLCDPYRAASRAGIRTKSA